MHLWIDPERDLAIVTKASDPKANDGLVALARSLHLDFTELQERPR